GGEDHSFGSTCLTSYMKYMPTLLGAPASSVANTPGNPSVGTRSARWKPASRNMRRKSCTPSSAPTPSAGMVGWRIPSCKRRTDSSWRFWISRSTGPRSAARASRGSINQAAPASEPRKSVRRERLSMRLPHKSGAVVSSTNTTRVSCEAVCRQISVRALSGGARTQPDLCKTAEGIMRKLSRKRIVTCLCLSPAGGAVGVLAAGASAPFWGQWGRTPDHTGMVPVAGQTGSNILANIVYDPFTSKEQSGPITTGDLLVHYQTPLVDGN